LQDFINFAYFEKKYIQGHTNSHPRKSHFEPPKLLFRTSRDPGNPGWEQLIYCVENFVLLSLRSWFLFIYESKKWNIYQ